MGTKSILAGFVLAFCAASSVSHATVVTGGTVQTISASDSSVYAYDQATVELVNGADVGWLYMNAQSRLNVFDGLAAWTFMSANSNAAIQGGDLSWLKMYDNSHVDITNGILSWLQMFEASTANIYKADISWLVLAENSKAEIYGSNFAYSGGHLSGNWADGTPFSFWALSGNAQGMPTVVRLPVLPENIVLHVVPAPATAYLMMLALPLLTLSRGRLLTKPSHRSDLGEP